MPGYKEMYETPHHTEDLSRYTFLITGGAGFIGSNLVEYLLKYGAKKVRVLDNFSTGSYHNIEEFKGNSAFELIEGDIRDLDVCRKSVKDIDYISHQAALGSVPRSIKDPLTTNAVNVSGFLNILWAVKENGNVKALIYAASSSTYGDSKELPKVENRIGKPLSPYAVTKYINELYADVFSQTYGLQVSGLRYFNVFGPKQSPQGEYAAVIPLFINAIKDNRSAFINGDGEQTRDFTFVEDAVQANIKAWFSKKRGSQVYNIAFGQNTSLNRLWDLINEIEGKHIKPIYRESRAGDIQDSLADISHAAEFIGYSPLFDLKTGLEKTSPLFSATLSK